MMLLVGAVLAVLSIAIVVYPFLKKSRAGVQPDVSHDSVGAPPMGPGVADLELVYEAIRTLQLEYQLGKVPEEEYQEQLRAYRLQAAVALRRAAQEGHHASGLEAPGVSER